MSTPPPGPGQPGWRGRRPPPDPATQRIRRPPAPPRNAPITPRNAPLTPRDAPTTRRDAPTTRRDAPTERMRAPRSPDPRPVPPPGPPSPPSPKVSGRGFLNVPSMLLIGVIVVALGAAGLASAELYARQRAEKILVQVAECVVRDKADVSFGVNPPFLWQHATGHYTDVTVTTAGDRVQDANGMTAVVTLEDVRLQGNASSQGTIGILHATLTWKSSGIKDTVAANLPGVGDLITSVSTIPAAGTIVLQAGENGVTAKPVVNDGDLSLQVLEVKGSLPRDAVQSALDGLTKKLNDNYPLGIHADDVRVTESGVVGTFSSREASIPKEDTNPCFARI